jgi:hypothetical protein
MCKGSGNIMKSEYETAFDRAMARPAKRETMLQRILANLYIVVAGAGIVVLLGEALAPARWLAFLLEGDPQGLAPDEIIRASRFHALNVERFNGSRPWRGRVAGKPGDDVAECTLQFWSA